MTEAEAATIRRQVQAMRAQAVALLATADSLLESIPEPQPDPPPPPARRVPRTLGDNDEPGA